MSKKEIYETELPHRAVAVYLYLKDRANKEGTCYPAIGTIARELHLSVSTVKRAISDLEENGFIRKKQRWRDNGGRSSLLFEIIRYAQRGYCAGQVDYGMVHHGLCRELFNLRIKTEKMEFGII